MHTRRNPRRMDGSMRPTRATQVNAYLAEHGFPGVMLHRDARAAYCHFYGGDADYWDETGVYVPRISDLTLDGWLQEAQRLAQTKRNPRRRNPEHTASGLTDERLLKIACVGMCGEFAVALNETHGYPLGAFYEVGPDGWAEGDFTLLHAFAYHPSGKVVDSKGIRSKAEMKRELLVMSGGKVKEAKTTRGDLDALSMEGLDAGVLAHAKDYILRHPETYAPEKRNPARPARPKKFSNAPLTAREEKDIEAANVYLMDWVCDGWGPLPPRIAEFEARQTPFTNAEKRELIHWFHENAPGNFS